MRAGERLLESQTRNSRPARELPKRCIRPAASADEAGETAFRGQDVGLKLLRETLIEARAGREVVFEELVERPWIVKGKTKETMSNFFDLQTRQVTEYVDGIASENQARY